MIWLLLIYCLLVTASVGRAAWLSFAGRNNNSARNGHVIAQTLVRLCEAERPVSQPSMAVEMVRRRHGFDSRKAKLTNSTNPSATTGNPFAASDSTLDTHLKSLPNSASPTARRVNISDHPKHTGSGQQREITAGPRGLSLSRDSLALNQESGCQLGDVPRSERLRCYPAGDTRQVTGPTWVKLTPISNTLGEASPLAKLTADKVIAILELTEQRTPFEQIAGQFQVSVVTVTRIAKRQTWKHLIGWKVAQSKPLRTAA